MYVYLLRHATEPRFKIGKAVDIYQRIPYIGGIETYDIENSRCIKLSTEAKAYNLEKALHKLFNDWSHPIDENNRYSGDTEQFKIECFNRVIDLLVQSTDIMEGALPISIPSRTTSFARNTEQIKERNRLKTEENLRKEIKRKQTAYKLAAAWKVHDETFFTFITECEKCFCELIEIGINIFGVVENRLIRIETNDNEILERAQQIAIKLNTFIFSPQHLSEWSKFSREMIRTSRGIDIDLNPRIFIDASIYFTTFAKLIQKLPLLEDSSRLQTRPTPF